MNNTHKIIRTLVTGFTLSMLMASSVFAQADNEKLTEMLNQTSTLINESLPISGELMDMHSTEVVGKQLIFHNSLKTPADQVKPLFKRDQNAVTQNLAKNICYGSSFKPLLNAGATIVYSYKGSDNKFAYQISITQQHCTVPKQADDMPLRAYLEQELKDINSLTQLYESDPTRSYSGKITDTSLSYIFNIKQVNAQQFNQQIISQAPSIIINDKNNACTLYASKRLLNKGATLFFEFYGNDNKLAYKASFDKKWCSYSQAQKLAEQKAELETNKL